MIKRIIAWLLLLGFVFLILNITFIGFYRELTFLIYLIIVVFFLFNNKRNRGLKESNDTHNANNDDTYNANNDDTNNSNNHGINGGDEAGKQG